MSLMPIIKHKAHIYTIKKKIEVSPLKSSLLIQNESSKKKKFGEQIPRSNSRILARNTLVSIQDWHVSLR